MVRSKLGSMSWPTISSWYTLFETYQFNEAMVPVQHIKINVVVSNLA